MIESNTRDLPSHKVAFSIQRDVMNALTDEMKLIAEVAKKIGLVEVVE
jgi:hypothetical protein